MAKKRNTKKPQNPQPVSYNPISLRQESTGKLQSKAKPKSLLKLEHLERVALWASKEGSVPSLAALFGTQLAAAKEALCVPPDPSLIQCQRCETVLQPGFNCTVRVEKIKVQKKRRRHKKPNSQLQNKVIYKCHFCSHQNQKRGTSKGHMQEICPPKVKSSKKPKTVESVLNSASSEAGTSKENEEMKTAICSDTCTRESPSTPSVNRATTLLDAMKRTRKRSTSKKAEQAESKTVAHSTAGASKKRKKKSWTSLKEIAESSERGRSESFRNLTIPFVL